MSVVAVPGRNDMDKMFAAEHNIPIEIGVQEEKLINAGQVREGGGLESGSRKMPVFYYSLAGMILSSSAAQLCRVVGWCYAGTR